jgi:hypothetical protein
MLTVKDIGEPCARKPHARFDGRGLETGNSAMDTGQERPLETAGRLAGTGLPL